MRNVDVLLEETGRDINCLDEPSFGGACHEYTVTEQPTAAEAYDEYSTAACEKPYEAERTEFARIKFQEGPESEHGINGIQDIDLLHIYRDRLLHFQRGEHACAENVEMLAHLDQVLWWNLQRTNNRKNRNVEGTSKK